MKNTISGIFVLFLFLFSVYGCERNDELNRDQLDPKLIERTENLLYEIEQSGFEKWKKLYETEEATHYTGIGLAKQDEKREWIKTGVLLVDYKSKRPFLSSTLEMIIDCRSWKFKLTRQFDHKSSMGKSSPVAFELDPNVKMWNYPPSNTPGDNMLKVLCDLDDLDEEKIESD